MTDGQLTAYNEFKDEEVPIPDEVQKRTEALLSLHPTTNQRIVLVTATWWLENCGNHPIYRWAIHHLDKMENDVQRDSSAFHEAHDRAEEIGLNV